MGILDTAKYRDRVLDGLQNLSEDGVEVVNGQGGGRYIGGTSLNTGNWLAIQVLADAKFHTLAGNIAGSADTTSGSAPVIPAGIVLFGSFTALQLHSGRVIAYNA
jgi:hypothetical protein